MTDAWGRRTGAADDNAIDRADLPVFRRTCWRVDYYSSCAYEPIRHSQSEPLEGGVVDDDWAPLVADGMAVDT